MHWHTRRGFNPYKVVWDSNFFLCRAKTPEEPALDNYRRKGCNSSTKGMPGKRMSSSGVPGQPPGGAEDSGLYCSIFPRE